VRLATLRGKAALISPDGTQALYVGDSVREILSDWAAFTSQAPTYPWDRAVELKPGELDAPVPDPRQVFAIALNYAPHAAEAGYTAPDVPLVFTKFPSCITGPNVTVPLPAGNVDWEIEVVAVVGLGGYEIAEEGAWDALAGVTLGQDLSERLTQLTGRPAQFSLGKSFPRFGPTGPWIVTADELPDPDDIAFSSTLDGVPLQSGRTADMIFSIPRLVAHLSSVCELLPGDLIFTGTPEGVGNRLDPPRFLRPGETLVSRADGIGEIAQRFVS
jgi:2-keto-4-pentenoate hydratase/2-oxohepta-3-ene-1,7-dioic acid hydratase in catechol pathway